MKETKKILVTGAGALLGQGILRTLRLVHGHDFLIYSADPDYRATGHWLSDYALTIPMADDPDYMNVVESIIKKYEIDLVLIGTDVELKLFSLNRKSLEEKYKCHVIVSPESTIEIGNDKWITVEFLKKYGLPYPDSAISNQSDEIQNLIQRSGFPLFSKPKIGARSVGARKVIDQTELETVLDNSGKNIIQEYLPLEDGEYTAGTMVFEGDIFFTIVLRRDLRDGNTYRAYSVLEGKYVKELNSVIDNLEIYGPCNFQFRIKDNKPVIFEINSRFSGTTPLRAFFGINETQVLLDYIFKGQKPESFKINEGAVFRTLSDIFVNNDDLIKLRDDGELEHPKADYYPFKLE